MDADRTPLPVPLTRPPAAAVPWSSVQAGLVVADALAAWAGIVAAAAPAPAGDAAEALLLLLLAAALLASLSAPFGAYRPRVVTDPASGARRFAAALAGATLAAGMLTAALPVDGGPALAAWAGVTGLLAGAARLGQAALVARWRAEGRLAHRVVVVGTPELIRAYVDGHRAVWPPRARVLGCCTLDGLPPDGAGCPWLGSVDALLGHPELEGVDRVVLALPWSAEREIRRLLHRLRVVPVEIDVAPDLLGHRRGETAPPSVKLVRRPLDDVEAAVKRAEDLLLGLPLLLAALPALLVIAALVRLDSPGPALFLQRRYGFHGRPITVHKFRTMRDDCADAAGARQEERDDPRVTRLGRFLRRTRLDELPQLIDVLRGDMSLVGPRPYPAGMRIDHGTAHDVLAEYARRHAVKPGITGWAQVNGLAGPVTTEDGLRRRIECDLVYIDHWSVAFDLLILWRTAVMTLRQLLRRGGRP